MNNSKGVFKNTSARKAVAWGIGRNALVDVRGPRAGHAQCNLLTPAIPGYKQCKAFGNNPNLSKARPLASGHTGDQINYWYTASTTGTQIQQLASAQLNAIGFRNIQTRPFQSGSSRHWAARATTTTSRSSAGLPTSRIRMTT